MGKARKGIRKIFNGKDKVKISVIVVNYKVRERLIECISSLNSLNHKVSFEVIVVDNEGDKELEHSLKKIKNTRYIKSKKNIGFGAGNNLGARYAKGEYLFFLNPDTIVIDNVVDKIYEFIKKNKNVGIVSPLLVDNNRHPFKTQSRKELTPLNSLYSFSFLRKIFSQKNIYNDKFFKKWDYKNPLEVQVIPGAALMISKQLFNKVGGFDEKFFLYFEENDLSKRVRNLGLKLFLIPTTRVIHKVAQSTKLIDDSEKIFNKSRFYFLKKHYGLTKALMTEMIIRINKYSSFLFLGLILAFALRVYNIENGMPFIGDQGWFYLSARDLILLGKVPLVGITSSHVWLHQGPLWTYMLAPVLFLFKFNPISGAFITIALGVGTVFLIYKLGVEMFSKNIGLIACFLYASSPLIVYFDRIPFDPGPIPFFALLYFYSIFKWLNGKITFFPFIFLFAAILYNLELATFTLLFPLVLIVIYGFLTKKDWLFLSLNKITLLWTLILFIIPMVPVIIYDFSHGFNQTVVFLGWTIYKPFSFLIKHSSENSIANLRDTMLFLFESLKKIIFTENIFISILIFLSGFVIIAKKIYSKKDTGSILLLLISVFSLGGILINQTKSDAYLPIIFPFVILVGAFFFDYFIRASKLTVFIFALVVLLNTISVMNSDKVNYFSDRMTTANKIIKLTNGQKYNLIGKGEGSQYESFTMNYEYILWWKENPVSKHDEKLKIVIYENKGKTEVTKLEK